MQLQFVSEDHKDDPFKTVHFYKMTLGDELYFTDIDDDRTTCNAQDIEIIAADYDWNTDGPIDILELHGKSLRVKIVESDHELLQASPESLTDVASDEKDSDESSAEILIKKNKRTAASSPPKIDSAEKRRRTK